jgi:hypothetical protein
LEASANEDITTKVTMPIVSPTSAIPLWTTTTPMTGSRNVLCRARGCRKKKYRSNAFISEKLQLTNKTVRNYVSTILTKLQAASRSEAIVRAPEAGIGKADRVD